MKTRKFRVTLGPGPGVILLVLLLSASLVSPAAAAVPEGQVGLRLLDVPTDRAQDPRARLYIIDHVQGGDSIERRIEVSSGLDEPVEIEMYAAGASVEQGEFRFFEGTRGNELSGWTAVSPRTLQVPARGSAIATVVISVPPNASGGERYGVVWAELPPAETESGVSEISRVGIRMYLSVGGSEPDSDFEIESLTPARSQDGSPEVRALVRNTGGRALDLSGSLTLTEGPGELSAGPFPAEAGTTLGAGDSASVRVPLSAELPAGPWRAHLKMRSGLIRRTAEATITFPEAGERAPAIPPDAGARWLFKVLATIVLLVVALLLFLWLRRRREDEATEA